MLKLRIWWLRLRSRRLLVKYRAHREHVTYWCYGEASQQCSLKLVRLAAEYDATMDDLRALGVTVPNARLLTPMRSNRP